MNKNELVKAAAQRSGVARKETAAVLEAVLASITEHLAGGGKVQIAGFGTFEVRTTAEHEGINPATKEKITIPATRRPAFHPGRPFKELVG